MTDSLGSSAGQVLLSAAPNNSLCPTMGIKTRLTGFFICALIGNQCI